MCKIEENESGRVCPDTGWGGPLDEAQTRAFRAGVKRLLYEANPNELDQFLELIDSVKDNLPAEGLGKIESFYGKLEELGVKVERVNDIERNKMGIDVVVTMRDGSHVYIGDKPWYPLCLRKLDTDHLCLEIWKDRGGIGKFTKGWFMDESKKTDWYCFIHTKNQIDYATFVKVKDLRYRILSSLKLKELYDINGYANKAVKTKIEGASIYDSPKCAHRRLLIIPLEFFGRIPSTRTVII